MDNYTFSFLTTAIAVMIGGILTWLFAWFYYAKAGNALKEETKEIRKLINCMIILQKDENGVYIPKIDEEGKLVTIYANISAKLSGSSSVSGDLKAKKV